MNDLPKFGFVGGFLVATNNGARVAFRADSIIAVESDGEIGGGCELHLAQSDRVYPIDQCLESVLAVIPMKEDGR
jgi:hypothetical protein